MCGGNEGPAAGMGAKPSLRVGCPGSYSPKRRSAIGIKDVYVLRLCAQIDGIAKFRGRAAIGLRDNIAVGCADMDQRLVSEGLANIDRAGDEGRAIHGVEILRADTKHDLAVVANLRAKIYP